jgi:hypothetical protein
MLGNDQWEVTSLLPPLELRRKWLVGELLVIIVGMAGMAMAVLSKSEYVAPPPSIFLSLPFIGRPCHLYYFVLQWLNTELAESAADINIIVSSVQLLTGRLCVILLGQL